MNDHEAAVREFARDLKEALDDTIEWIDSPLADVREGVDEADATVANALHVEVGVGVDGLELDEIGDAETDLNEFADEHGVAVDLVRAEPGTCIYRFSLQGMFVGGAPKATPTA